MKMIVACVVMMMMSGLASAQINKCIDKTGKVVGYGSECPPGSASEKMTINTAPPSASPQQKSVADRDADFRKRQVEKQEAQAKGEKKSAEAERRKQACESSQAYLKSIESGQRISRTDPKTGERVYLADPEYGPERARARAQVEANCK